MAGCNGGAIGPAVPGMANAQRNFYPGARDMRTGPCGPGVHREGMPDCNGGATGAMVQGVMTFMQMLAPAAPPPH
jgi:hypothetical protein